MPERVAKQDWVKCPICGEPDMRMDTDLDGNPLIYCVNHGCRSNTPLEENEKPADAPIEQGDLVVVPGIRGPVMRVMRVRESEIGRDEDGRATLKWFATCLWFDNDTREQSATIALEDLERTNA